YKLYQQIFSNSSHPHITPDLKSVHYLATYHQLVNSTRSGELVVGDKTPDIKELKSLVRESKILEECSLLQDLGIVIGTKNGGGEWQGKLPAN
ncbi:MAG: KAP family P-loop domain-containing protein, partial [Cyanobacteria bacterium QS_5_48_63]